jgi:type II pantothenate kinase
MDEVKALLKEKSTQIDAIFFTGGKSFILYNDLKTEFKANLINEFDANARGTKLLIDLEKEEMIKSALLVTIGTGTSIVLLGEKPDHLGGSALGGAFFMGVLKLLYNETDYNSAVTAAIKGNRYHIDLKVGDIYHPEDDRVDHLFRQFTAASFGKINEFADTKSIKREDLINSLICLIGENVGTLGIKMAELQEIENIVYCGGFLKENEVLKSLLRVLCLVNRKNPIFLNNSEYIGALGAISHLPNKRD